MVTLQTAKAQGDTAPVVVDNVVAVKDGAKLAQYSVSVKFEDKEAPTIKKVESVTKNTVAEKITVEFSEPVQSVGVVRIGEDYATATLEADGTYSIRFSDAAKQLEVGKSYNLTINNIVDFAGNSTAELNASVTVTRDEVKPTFTISPVNGTTFDVKFDKEMSPTAPAYDAITVKNAKDETLTLAGLPELQSDKKTYRVTLATSPIEVGKSSAVISVKVDKFTDKIGNEVSAKTESVTLTKDVTKPEMVSVKVSSVNKNVLEVTFSEKVTGIIAGDFVLTNKATKAEIPVVSVLNAANGSTTSVTNKDNKVFLNFGSLPNGDYTLALKVNTVTDTSGNTNAAKAIDVTQSSQALIPLNVKVENKYGSDYTTAPVSVTDLKSTQNDRKFVVTFDSADLVDDTLDGLTGDFKVGSAANPALYTVGGQALPTGTVVTFKDNVNYGFNGGSTATVDMVEIDLSGVNEDLLPAALKNGGDIQVTVNGVKTNTGATAYTSTLLTVADATVPKMTSAYLTASTVDPTNNYTLVVNFSEKVTAAVGQTIAPAKFEIAGLKTDGVSAAAPAVGTGTVVGAGTTTLKIEVEKTQFGTSGNLIDLTKGSLKVKALTGHNVTDMATTPVPLVDNSEIAVTNWATQVDVTAPTATLPVATGATNSATALVATFNEELYINGVAVVDGTDVKTSFTAAGGTLAITSAIYNKANKTVTFALSNAQNNDTITHNTGATALTDAAGNAYAAKVYTYANTTTLWSSN